LPWRKESECRRRYHSAMHEHSHEHHYAGDDGHSELDPTKIRVRGLQTVLTQKGYIQEFELPADPMLQGLR
jgi:hypothetical protein